MNNTLKLAAIIAAITALIVGSTLLFTPAADAIPECTDCGGTVRSVGPAWGMGATCAEATQDAKSTLLTLSIQNSPNGCIPCNTQDTVVTPCQNHNGQVRTDITRTFQCRFCDFDPIDRPIP